jgi:two-component system chemotaxis response regulator CheB
MRALVVDDSRPSRSIISRALRDLRFECIEATNGAEALESLATSPRPDLVTINWHMPVMDGLELVKRLRESPRYRDLRLLMISTESDRTRIAQARSSGVDDYLSKPFTSASLAQSLVDLGICSSAEVVNPTSREPIRVLIVDDSATIRGLLSATLGADPDLKVVGAAVNGKQGVEMIATVEPDIVILDVEMPVLDGIGALREIRRKYPKLPVVMFSSLTERGAKTTLEALLAGATDYAAKPAGLAANEVTSKIREEVITKMKALLPRGVSRPKLATPPPLRRPPISRAPVQGIVIATSTGGPAALVDMLPAFVKNCPVPVLIVQHMPAFFTTQLAERLTKTTGTPVREAADRMALKPGDVVLAPGGRHLMLAPDAAGAAVRLTDDPPENSCRPSADVLFRSAAAAWGPGTLGIVLTGMGSDGLAGSRAIVEAGGGVLAQDEFSSVVWGMPGEVARAGLADAVLPLAQLGAEVAVRLRRRGG